MRPCFPALTPMPCSTMYRNSPGVASAESPTTMPSPSSGTCRSSGGSASHSSPATARVHAISMVLLYVFGGATMNTIPLGRMSLITHSGGSMDASHMSSNHSSKSSSGSNSSNSVASITASPRARPLA